MIKNLEVPAQWGLPGCFLKAGIMAAIALISQLSLPVTSFQTICIFESIIL
jgi:hypothetical protein